MDDMAARIKTVCKALPISFYCKRKIECDFTEDETSTYDAFNDELHISIKQIAMAISNAGDITEKEFEMLCRSNFYHEVSHAILSPNELFDFVGSIDDNWRIAKDVLNIFEDERIETLLNKFYINVDFKRSLFTMNGDAYLNEPTSAVSLFYKVVRFRASPEKSWLKQVTRIINAHSRVSRVNCGWRRLTDYVVDVQKLWHDVKQYWGELQAKKQKQGQPNDDKFDNEPKSNGSEQEESSPLSCASDDKAEPQHDDQQKTADMVIEDAISAAEKEVEVMGIRKHDIEAIVSEAFTKNEHEDAALFDALQKIIMSSKLSSKKNAAALNGWSGVIDPRLSDRDDKRFFVQKSRGGHLKQNAKLHLTFYQDVSGSYCDDVKPTNDLLYALSKLEQECSDFSFDVIAINTSIKVLPKRNRKIKAGGGTELSGEIFKIVREMHKPDAVNKSIVMFDGECALAHNFAAFNSSDFIFIYEQENSKNVDAYCPNARKMKVTGSFAENLKKVALSAIEAALR